MTSKFINKQIESHQTKFEAVGRSLFFYKVKSGRSENIYNIGVRLTCDCEHWSNEGVVKGKLCSHLRKVLLEMAETGRVDLQNE